jgi:hypothetical protein
MQENNNPPSLWFFIKLAISSFLLIHLFGLFGVFVAFAYPLWWFFLPQKTFCFFCLHKKLTDPQGTCPICKRSVMNIYDPPLASVFANMVTIVFLSAASLFVIFAEIVLLTQGGLNPATLIYGRKAYFVIPEKNTFTIGREFYFDVNTSAATVPINVVQADMHFDKDLLMVKRIDTSQSFATIFTQKEYSNDEGWIRIIGGLPNPGYLGEYKQFARIYFLPKKAGVGKIEFLKSSRLLANDGHGTNILSEFPTSSIYITSEEKKVLGESTNITVIDEIYNRIRSFLKQ